MTLETIGKPRTILSFDFDGTLHDPAAEPQVPVAFFDAIRRIRESHHALWGVNTGRSVEFALEGMEDSGFPFMPDWIVAREREIYLPDANGDWLPHESWNQRCELEIAGLFERIEPLLDRIRHEVKEHTGAQWIEMQGEPASMVAQSEEEMAWIVDRFLPMVKDEPELSWQRNTIYLRFGHRDFNKGSSLSELARLHQLAAENCFAIGDSHNDTEMLDVKYAAMTACPANALELVRDQVKSHGGLITRAVHGDGVVEALAHYFGE